MKWLSIAVIAILSLCLVATLFISGFTELSQREALFLSILLTVLAIVISWLATSLASKSTSDQMRDTLKSEYTENLRTYALKAAEKVQNLSAEIERLNEYLAEPISSEQIEPFLLAREKLKTANLMLSTIKSVNDTALSDWRGVIGDDLKKQRVIETDIENIHQELELLENMMDASKAQQPLPGFESKEIDNEVEDIKESIEKTIEDYAQKSPIPIRIPKRKRIDSIVKCPNCQSDNQTRLFLREGYRKVLKCRNCGSYFMLNVDLDSNIKTEIMPTKPKEIICVICNKKFVIQYPLWSGYSFQPQCPNCTSRILASVNTELELQYHQSEETTKKFLEFLGNIANGIYPSEESISSIASTLGISKSKVSQGFDVLLHLGRIKPIINNKQTLEQKSENTGST
jgi:hypothetical protein